MSALYTIELVKSCRLKKKMNKCTEKPYVDANVYTNPAFTSMPFGLGVCIFQFAFSDFFFSLHMNSNITWVHCAGDKNHCLHTVHSIVHVLKNIKNGSHRYYLQFKIYFFTVFSVFNFSNNKFNPNRPIVLKNK